MMRLVSFERAMGDANLLGAALGDCSTWQAWIATGMAAYGQPLGPEERAAFDRVAGGRRPPAKKVKELVACVSRRAGKGRFAAALATYEAAIIDHRAHLAPGETGVVACISPTIMQARIVLRYISGFFEASPVLRGEIAEVLADEIRLRNGIVICTLTNDFRSIRGRTLLIAILDEASFLRDETSSTPDIEAARALLPGLSTTGGMLVIISSPYRRLGLLFQRKRDFFGKNDERVLVVAGPSTAFNPTLDLEMIEAARVDDPQAALSEWDGEFRNDRSSFLDDAAIDAAIDRSRPAELPRRSGINYFCFIDASAGRHDAFTQCIVHREGEGLIADVVRGRKPPFDPATVAAEYGALAKEYGCRRVTGDNYSGDWVVNAFRAVGIEYRRSELTRSELYLEGSPLFARGLVSIPDNPILLRELRLLERRVARSGKDSVDHGVGGSDDYANSLFGAVWCAVSKKQPLIISNEALQASRAPASPMTFGNSRRPMHYRVHTFVGSVGG